MPRGSGDRIKESDFSQLKYIFKKSCLYCVYVLFRYLYRKPSSGIVKKMLWDLLSN